MFVLFPNPHYTSKQPRDGVVPPVPCTGIFLGPSKSGKTVAIISAILEQYRTADGSSVFERIFLFSPSIHIDDGWKPVKEFIENEMGVNTDREQVYFDKWDEGALRTIIELTRTSKQLGLKKLYQVLVVIDDYADQPELHRRTGDGALDTLFIRGRHTQISTWVSSQKLRLISAAVRVNMQFICIWRLRNQLELEAVLEELSALLLAMYQEATREPYSFWFIYYLKDKANMFYKRWEERFVVDGDAEPAEDQQPVNGRLPLSKLLGGGPVLNSQCGDVRCCTSTSAQLHDPRSGAFLSTDRTTWIYLADASGLRAVAVPPEYSGRELAQWLAAHGCPQAAYLQNKNRVAVAHLLPAGATPRQPRSLNQLLTPSLRGAPALHPTDESTCSLDSIKAAMTTVYVDSRRRVSGSDSNFAFELPETLHMQSSAKLAVYKVRIADAFLSTRP